MADGDTRSAGDLVESLGGDKALPLPLWIIGATGMSRAINTPTHALAIYYTSPCVSRHVVILYLTDHGVSALTPFRCPDAWAVGRTSRTSTHRAIRMLYACYACYTQAQNPLR